MNNLQPNTSGIDCEIKAMQTSIYDALNADFDNVAGFGRVYRVPTENKPIACVFDNGTTNDYKEIYLDDRNDVQFCFIDEERHKTSDGVVYIAPVKVVFWFNLSILGEGFRADAEAHRLVSVILDQEVYSEFQITGIEKGVENVFRGFETSKIIKADLHPYHLFSFNIDLSYYLNRKCS